MKALIAAVPPALVAVPFLIAALAWPAAGQTVQCAPLDQVVEGLEARWQETPVARGMQGADLIIMVFASPDGATWSVLGISPDGTACLLASGADWQALPTSAPGEDS